jgi:hypothetical protein
MRSTAAVNQVRGLLLERGITLPKGRRYVDAALPRILTDPAARLSGTVLVLLAELKLELAQLAEKIDRSNSHRGMPLASRADFLFLLCAALLCTQAPAQNAPPVTADSLVDQLIENVAAYRSTVPSLATHETILSHDSSRLLLLKGAHTPKPRRRCVSCGKHLTERWKSLDRSQLSMENWSDLTSTLSFPLT